MDLETREEIIERCDWWDAHSTIDRKDYESHALSVIDEFVGYARRAVGEVEELRAELAKAQAATTAALGDVHALFVRCARLETAVSRDV